jgi:hypothetical protein
MKTHYTVLSSAVSKPTMTQITSGRSVAATSAAVVPVLSLIQHLRQEQIHAGHMDDALDGGRDRTGPGDGNRRDARRLRP